MEPIQKLQGIYEVGVAPTSYPLEKKHDDLDILQGCPRTLMIQGTPVTQRAFRNHEFSNVSTILLWLGFGTCETEQDVDNITIDDIYTNISMNSVTFGSTINARSLEELLYGLMEFPKDLESKPEFFDITKDEFQKFLAVIIEQNNFLQIARRQAKKNLKMMGQISQSLIGQ